MPSQVQVRPLCFLQAQCNCSFSIQVQLCMPKHSWRHSSPCSSIVSFCVLPSMVRISFSFQFFTYSNDSPPWPLRWLTVRQPRSCDLRNPLWWVASLPAVHFLLLVPLRLSCLFELESVGVSVDVSILFPLKALWRGRVYCRMSNDIAATSQITDQAISISDPSSMYETCSQSAAASWRSIISVLSLFRYYLLRY